MTSEFNFPKEAFGYIEGAVPAKMVYSDTEPTNPVEGLFWVVTLNGEPQQLLRFYTGNTWLTYGLSNAIVSETVPSYVQAGTRWYKPSEVSTYIYYCDADSCQWVEETTPVTIVNQTQASIISETVPVFGVAPGVRWYKPSEGVSYIYYCDENSCQWVQEAASLMI